MFFIDKKKIFLIILAVIILNIVVLFSLVQFDIISINQDKQITDTKKVTKVEIDKKNEINTKKNVNINDFIIRTEEIKSLKGKNGLLYIKNNNCNDCEKIDKTLKKILSDNNLNLFILDLSDKSEKEKFDKYLKNNKEISSNNTEFHKLQKDLFSMNTVEDKEILQITKELSDIEAKYNINDPNMPTDIQAQYRALQDKLNVRVNEKFKGINEVKNKVANKVYTDSSYSKEDAVNDLKILENEQKLSAEKIYELILLEEKVNDTDFLFNSLEFVDKTYTLMFIMNGKSYKDISSEGQFSISEEILNNEESLYDYLWYKSGLYQIEERTELKEFMEAIQENKNDSIFVYNLGYKESDNLVQELIKVMEEKGIKTANIMNKSNNKDFSIFMDLHKIKEKPQFVFIKTKKGHIREMYDETDLLINHNQINQELINKISK